ncbi:MAG: hypothetical protein CMJ34_11635 [Phycisphaerae bacterium]|nr:hypothetical protein [Phycisphaerae bacterium]
MPLISMAEIRTGKTLRRLLLLGVSSLVLTTSGVAVAEDWSDIRDNYDQLKRYMAAKRRIGADEKASLIALQERIDAFREGNPEDPRPLAMDIQVSTWLGDDARIDEDYEQLAAISDLDRIQVAWAKHRLGMNGYGSIPGIILSDPVDLADEPEANVLLARSYMARNQFQDAIDAIDAIPEEGLQKPSIRVNANRVRGQAERWLALWQDEVGLREAEEAAGTSPVMQLITSRGPVTILLYETQAPNTVANFIELAERDFFDGTRFHRVEPNFVVQGGDPNSRPGSTIAPGSGGRGQWIPDEADRPDKRFHFAGSLAMAKSPDQTKPGSTIPNSASSQFYVVIEPAENLNEEYTVFGRVIDGIEIIEAIRKNDDLLEVATISRPERDYSAETLAIPGVPEPGTTIPPTGIEGGADKPAEPAPAGG